jgi:hypothetical protein
MLLKRQVPSRLKNTATIFPEVMQPSEAALMPRLICPSSLTVFFG